MIDVVAGIDLGATFTKFGLVSRQGELLGKASISTDSTMNYEQFFDLLIEELNALKNSLDPGLSIKGIGIGAPDANSINGKIYNASNLAWGGVVPVVQVMETKTSLPVALVNDANAAAIGEMLFGVAKGMTDFIAITLGTGLGSGIVINGELVIGHDSHAGELGHTTVFYNGRSCGCGRSGCLEAYVSATGLVRTVREYLENPERESLLRHIDSAYLNARNVTEAALEGDELALEAFDFTASVLGMKLAEFIAFSSPEAIIFSGGLSNAGSILLDPTRKYMEENLLEVYKNKVKMCTSALGVENVAILGAAASIWKMLEKEEFEYTSEKIIEHKTGI